MKSFILVLLFLNTLIGFSQGNEIYGNSWYLESVHHNGTTHQRPINHDSFSNTFFSQSTMFTSICETGGIIADIDIDTDTSEITFSDFNYYPGDCTNGDSILFRDVFFDFFEEIFGAVDYTIATGGDGVKSLTIENNGNSVVYKNALNLPPEEILLGNWHLQQLIIDGNSYDPPANEEVPYVTLSFEENYQLQTYVCGYVVGLGDFYPNLSYFYIYEMEQQAVDCADPDNNSFQNLYLNFFWNNYLNEFTYTYENSGDEETFIIYDIDGNEAVYAKQPLSLDDVSDSSSMIYPNPSNGVITIAHAHGGTLSYEVYNVVGQTITQGVMDGSTTTLDLSNNHAGIYFIKLQDTHSKSVVTKKLVIK